MDGSERVIGKRPVDIYLEVANVDEYHAISKRDAALRRTRNLFHLREADGAADGPAGRIDGDHLSLAQCTPPPVGVCATRSANKTSTTP